MALYLFNNQLIRHFHSRLDQVHAVHLTNQYAVQLSIPVPRASLRADTAGSCVPSCCPVWRDPITPLGDCVMVILPCRPRRYALSTYQTFLLSPLSSCCHPRDLHILFTLAPLPRLLVQGIEGLAGLLRHISTEF